MRRSSLHDSLTLSLSRFDIFLMSLFRIIIFFVCVCVRVPKIHKHKILWFRYYGELPIMKADHDSIPSSPPPFLCLLTQCVRDIHFRMFLRVMKD